MRKFFTALVVFVMFIGFASATPESNNENGIYTIDYVSSTSELAKKFSFNSKEAFNQFLDSKKLNAFDLTFTFEGSAGVGQNYVKIKVSGPCAEARAEFDRQMASFEEQAGSWWDDVKNWWDSL
jgi:hypothetical protein